MISTLWATIIYFPLFERCTIHVEVLHWETPFRFHRIHPSSLTSLGRRRHQHGFQLFFECLLVHIRGPAKSCRPEVSCQTLVVQMNKFVRCGGQNSTSDKTPF